MKKIVAYFLCIFMIVNATVVVDTTRSYASEENLVTLSKLYNLDTQNDEQQEEYEPITEIADFDVYGTTYGYSQLMERSNPEGRAALYNELVRISKELWNSDEDIAASEDIIQGEIHYVIGTIDISQYNMSPEEIVETYYSFKNDNPLYYFASNTMVISGSQFVYVTDDDYQSGEDRKSYQDDIIAGLNEFGELIYGETSIIEKVLDIYEMLNDNLVYAYEDDGITPSMEPWAHNIIGYFDDTLSTGVCECYARTLQLVLNMAGIENYFISGFAGGEAHAWNMIKLDDDKYYYFDATWDDGNGGYGYFAQGSDFESDHIKNTSAGYGVDYLYDIPEESEEDYVYTGSFEIKDADDFDRIALNPAGQYTLTADIDFSDKLSSANTEVYYDIEFTGTLDGNGHSVTGLKCGLFETIGEGATVKNLKLYADFSGSKWNGVVEYTPQYKCALAVFNYGEIVGCHIDTSISDSAGRELQTVFACGFLQINYGTIADCTGVLNIEGFESDYTDFLFAAGYVFDNRGYITDSEITLNVKDNHTGKVIDIGGFAYNNYLDAYIENCTSVGSVTAPDNGLAGVGGIVVGNYGVVTKCTNYADVSSSTYLYGNAGIVKLNNFIVSECVNYGDISTLKSRRSSGILLHAGGIVGDHSGGVIIDCTNYGNIWGNQGNVGGIAGTGSFGCIIDGCINEGDITSAQPTGEVVTSGGIVGEANLMIVNGNLERYEATMFIKDCVNKGDITADWVTAGTICGMVSGAEESNFAVIVNCGNTGTVTCKEGTSKKCCYNDSDGVNFIVAHYNDSSAEINSDAYEDIKVTLPEDIIYILEGDSYAIEAENNSGKELKWISLFFGVYVELNDGVATGLMAYDGDSKTYEFCVAYTEDGAFDYVLVRVESEEGHTYVVAEEQEASCFHTGVIKKVCSHCTDVKYAHTSKVVHSEAVEYQYTVENEATCEEDGLRIKTCPHCEDSVEEVIEATGHTKGEWQVTVQATETVVGKKVKKCTKCSEVLETQDIPKLIVIPSKVTSSQVSVNQNTSLISKISVGTTVSKFISSVNEGKYVEIRKNNKKVESSSVLGTGMVLCILDGTAVKKQYSIVVTGDTNGDGKINITDMIAAKASILGKSNLTGAYKSGADTNGDGKINITDFIKIKAHLLGKSTISGVAVK